jgi:hypothetical protein
LEAALYAGVFMHSTHQDKKTNASQAELNAPDIARFTFQGFDEQPSTQTGKANLPSKHMWSRYCRSRLRQFARQ